MKVKKKKNPYRFGIFMLILFVLFTLAVKFIDVDHIGAKNSEIGFSTINSFFRDKLGYNALCYGISKYFGYLVLLTACMFALMGFIQLLRRRSIAKLDKNFISLAIFYAAVAFVYVFFELFVINYRPVILDEGLEPSYPSSHTILAICIMGSAIVQFKRLFKDRKQCKTANLTAMMICFIVVIFRFMSGVHWFTDIIGGIIISIGMVSIYNQAFIKIEIANRRKLRKRNALK